MPCCRLRSRCRNIPDQLLYEGHSLTIGRNRICRIKSLSCPRKLFKVTLRSQLKKEVILEDLKNNQTLTYGKMDVIKGPGFEYEIDFVDEKVPIIWSELSNNNLIKAEFKGGGDRSKEKISAFDLDGTIIETKSGKVFAVDNDDWCLIDQNIPKHLKKLTEEFNYRFIIITNQMGISSKFVKIEEFKKKIENILLKLDVPCTIFIAPNDDRYRKPSIGIWEYLYQESLSMGQAIDIKSSFFVGDAAGRKKASKASKGDHSSADLLFAYNCGLKFFTPEKFSKLIMKTDQNCIDLDGCELNMLMANVKVFNPRSVFLNDDKSSVLYTRTLLQDLVTNNEFQFYQLPEVLHCIMFVGLPATGKSTFFHNYLKHYNYDYINRDTLKTMDKCVAKMDECLKNNRKCVIDNLNVTIQHRSKFLDVANKHSVPVLAFYFELTVEHIFHNLKYRKLVDDKQQSVQKVTVYTARKNMQPLQTSEGFHRIVKVNFSPVFEDDRFKDLYTRFLLDK